MKVGILGFAHAHVNAYCTQWRQRGELAVEPTAGWDRDDARLDRAVEQHGVEPCASAEELLAGDVEAVVVAS